MYTLVEEKKEVDRRGCSVQGLQGGFHFWLNWVATIETCSMANTCSLPLHKSHHRDI